MIFEFAASPGFDFLEEFALYLGVAVNDDLMYLPQNLGVGFIKKKRLTKDLSLIQHHYVLKESLMLRRLSPENHSENINILFNINQVSDELSDRKDQKHHAKTNEFAIRISSPNLSSELTFPANKDIYFTVISISQGLLNNLLDIEMPNSVVSTILENSAPFLFYETMSFGVQKALIALTNENNKGNLTSFFLKIQVEFLIYFLFKRLLKRGVTRISSVNNLDISGIFKVRDKILTNLSTPPKLIDLSDIAGMSQSKMTDLFKQVFGDSIYNFYQNARMEEASYLLQNNNSVTQVGYRLGFTNLSHFSRLFQRYFGKTPKKFANSSDMTVV